MNKLTLILIVTTLFSFTSQASTKISGQIRTNTTWDKAGSPYLLTGIVEVAPGVTLTVEPGVTIELDFGNDYRGGIDVYGKLELNATATDSIHIIAKNKKSAFNIVFKESSFAGAQADTYKLAYCNFWNTSCGFGFNAHNVIVSKCTFNGDFPTSLYWSGAENASLVVKDNSFYGYVLNNHNNHLLEYIEISNNNFEHYNNTGWVISLAAHTNNGILVKDNLFNDNFVCVFIQSATPVSVVNNIFTNNTLAISNNTQGGGTNYTIENNVFTKNKVALEAKTAAPKTMTVKNNSFYENDLGIKVSSYSGATTPSMVIEHNCIYNNKESLRWEADYDYSFGANWWGTADSTKIDSLIFDYQDDFKVGKVTYSPYLIQAGSSCIGHNPNLWATSVTNIHSESASVKAYPNPFNNEVKFVSQSGAPFKQIELYDLLGKQVVLLNTINSKELSINTQQLTEGVYFYKLTHTDNSISTGKLSK